MSKLTLYTSPRCPFGRRALIAMAEKGLKYDLVSIPLTGELTKSETVSNFSEMSTSFADDFKGKSHADLVKIKEDYKKNINSTGEVPTLVVDGNIIAEADVVAEFIEDAFPNEGVSFMPKDAVQRAKIRHYIKILGGPGGVSGMYGLVMNQDPAKDTTFRDKVYTAFEKFTKMASPDGPFFLGNTFSLADVLLMPMYDQFSVVWPFFRGVELIPSDVATYPWAARMQAWAKAVKERESFKSFSQGENYQTMYVSYAAKRGRSTLN